MSARPEAVSPVAEVTSLPEPPAAVARKGKRRILVIAGVGALAIGGFLGYRFLNAHDQNTDDAQVEADVVALAARVGGQVIEVAVADNAHVKKGDVVFKLDPSDLAARVKQAEGELAAAKAQAAAADAQASVSEAGAKGGFSSAKAMVSTSLAQVSSADAMIAQAKANLVRAEADLRRVTTDLDRAKKLRAADAVPQSNLDSAQAAVDAAQAQHQAAQAQLQSSEESRRVAQSRVAEANGQLDTNAPVDAKVAVSRANADLAHARVTTAEAALDQARLNLSYATVVAPIDGVVSRLTARAGQLLSPGVAVAQVVPEETYVVANFKETQVGEMKPGQPVEIEVDALGGPKLHGHVESISGGTGSRFSLLPPDNSSGNFVKVVQRVPVRIKWDAVPKGAPLRAGMSVVATVHTGS